MILCIIFWPTNWCRVDWVSLHPDFSQIIPRIFFALPLCYRGAGSCRLHFPGTQVWLLYGLRVRTLLGDWEAWRKRCQCPLLLPHGHRSWRRSPPVMPGPSRGPGHQGHPSLPGPCDLGLVTPHYTSGGLSDLSGLSVPCVPYPCNDTSSPLSLGKLTEFILLMLCHMLGFYFFLLFCNYTQYFPPQLKVTP